MRLTPLLLLALTACFDTSAGRDRDGDGYENIELGGTDCDDENEFVHPDAPEVCNDGLDNDCNGFTDDSGVGNDEWFLDGDGDGYPDGQAYEGCMRPGDSFPDTSVGVDCDDDNPDIHPQVPERCDDGIDNNCNGIVDADAPNAATWYEDRDDDGIPGATPYSGCEAPLGSFASLGAEVDCDDTNGDVRPNTVEQCGDGVDNDCDGNIDDSGVGNTTYYVDADSDGYPGAPAYQACTAPSGSFSSLAVGVDCNDVNGAIHPNAAETWYDGIDQDCAGDDDYDADADGVRSDRHGGNDCDDTEPGVRPGVAEICDNGIDDDCSGGAPECEWRSSHAFAERTITNVRGVAYSPASIVFDSNQDGVDDIGVLYSDYRLCVAEGPLGPGPTTTASETWDYQLFGDPWYVDDNRPASPFGFNMAVDDSLIPSKLVGVPLNDGEMFGATLPLPRSGGLIESSEPPYVYADDRSYFGYAMAFGQGLSGAAGASSVALLQPPQYPSDWNAGLHVWESRRPSAGQGWVNDSDVLLSPGTQIDWYDIAEADLNSDNRLDVLVAGRVNGSTSNIRVAVVRGPIVDGSLVSFPYVNVDTLPSAPLAPQIGASRTALAVDIDHDGLQEIAVADSAGLRLVEAPSTGSVALSAGRVLRTTAVAREHFPVGVGDFNGDGVLDLVATGGGSIGVFFGPIDLDGASVRTADVVWEVGTNWSSLIGDFDNDGVDDLGIGDGYHLQFHFGSGL